MNHKAKISKLTELTVKIIIVLLGIYVLYKKIIVNQNISDLWIDIEKTFTNKNQFTLLILALLLVPLNIFLEGVKWKLQVKPIEIISYWKSFLSIFTGFTAGMFFPNRMGNFVGRVFMLEKGDRIKAAMVTIVGGMGQMIATVSIGLLSLIFFVKENFTIIFIAAISIITLLLIIYFNIHFLKYFQFLIPEKFKEKTKEYENILNKYKDMNQNDSFLSPNEFLIKE